MVSEITSLTSVYSTFYSGAGQRQHQSSVSLAFERGIHRWPVKSTVNSMHKGPVMRKMFPFDDIIKCNLVTHVTDKIFEHFLWNCSLVQATELHWWWVMLVQVMAWWPQEISHYLSQCWPNSMWPYGDTSLQRVKSITYAHICTSACQCP